MTLTVNITDFRKHIFAFAELIFEYGLIVVVEWNHRPCFEARRIKTNKIGKKDLRFKELLRKVGRGTDDGK